MVVFAGVIALFVDAFKAELRCGVSWAFWFSLTLFIVISGPFGSYQTMTVGRRLLIGVPLMFGFMVIGLTLRAAVFHWFKHLGFRRGAIVTACLAAAIIGPLALAILKLSSIGRQVTSPGLFELSLLVISLSLGHSVLRSALETEQESVTSSDSQNVAEGSIERPERLLHRIEPEQRGTILSMSMRDHYVDVNTCKGQVSLLLRFSDATAEVDPCAGVQVHRSHWVAWQAIEAVEVVGAKMHLKLKHGARVPVSKNHRGKLQARGLL